jgi:membrane-associated protease RseP (regulator of RpoE activity)
VKVLNSVVAVTLTMLSLFVSSVFAFDFYGANVTDKEVPSSYMNIGLFGYLPTVSDVTVGSIADKQGIKSGDIIVSINGKPIGKSSELNQFKTDALKVLFFRNKEKISKSFRVAGMSDSNAIAVENKLPVPKVGRQATALQTQQTSNKPKEVTPAQDVSLIQKAESNNNLFTRSIKPTQDQIVFENKKGKVIFSHSIHLNSLNEDQCMLCHRIANPTHEYIQSRLENHRAAHAFCRGCHQKIENAPTSDCLVCHKQKKK